MKTDPALDLLVTQGAITKYEYWDADENGDRIPPGGKSASGMCESQALVLTFPNGRTLALETWCSGSLENTGVSLRAW